MARSVEQILKQQLGNLLAEVAVLTAENEQLREERDQQRQAAKVAESPNDS
jgi:regulator of replication initiation timing